MIPWWWALIALWTGFCVGARAEYELCKSEGKRNAG